MNSRERVRKALNHQEADRIPLDIGAGRGCGINAKAYKTLLDYLGIEVEEIKIVNLTGQLAHLDDIVIEKLGIDVAPIRLSSPSNWTLDIKEEEDHYWFMDEWMIKWKMPKDRGHYYDMVEFPLAEMDFEEYPWPDPKNEARFGGIEERAERLTKETALSIIFPYTLGNGFLQMGAQLHGFEKWFMMMASERAATERFLDHYLQIKIEFWDSLLTRVGHTVDVICEVDDLGTQTSTWLSKDMYRQFIKPCQEKLFSFIKKKADVKIFLHSCGAIYDFIPDLIETGVDILNPIQVSATGMDSKRLKKEFGNDLVFWGGGIDTQRVLPYGSKKDVEEEVKRRIHDLAPQGGFVFSTVHNIQSDVPPENIVTMLETLSRYGQY